MAKRKTKNGLPKTIRLKGTLEEAQTKIEAATILAAAEKPDELIMVYRQVDDKELGIGVSHFHSGMSRFMVGYFGKVELKQGKDGFTLKGKAIDILAALYLLQTTARESKNKEEKQYAKPMEELLLSMMSFSDDQMEQVGKLEAIQATEDYMEVHLSLEGDNAQPDL